MWKRFFHSSNHQDDEDSHRPKPPTELYVSTECEPILKQYILVCTFINKKTNWSSKPASIDCECWPFSAKLHINQKKHVATYHTKNVPVTYAHSTLNVTWKSTNLNRINCSQSRAFNANIVVHSSHFKNIWKSIITDDRVTKHKEEKTTRNQTIFVLKCLKFKESKSLEISEIVYSQKQSSSQNMSSESYPSSSTSSVLVATQIMTLSSISIIST